MRATSPILSVKLLRPSRHVLDASSLPGSGLTPVCGDVLEVAECDLSIGGESDAVNRLKRACSAVLALLNHARITTLIEINFWMRFIKGA